MFFRKIYGKLKLKKLYYNGLKYGNNLNVEKGVIIDPSAPWLIEIGNNVTLAPYVHILSHDASTKFFVGYTKLGKVKIGNNVFIGAKSVVLPNVVIGDNVVIAANSVVSRDVPSNSVVAGSPAKEIMSIQEFIDKHMKVINKNNVFYRKKINNKKVVTNDLKNDILSKLSNDSSIIYID